VSSATAHLIPVLGVGVILTLVVGFYSLLVTRNLMRALIAIEILTKAVTLAIVAAGYFVGQMGLAQAMAITLIVIEVAIVAVAVGIIIGIYRHSKSLDVSVVGGEGEYGQ
jgi:multisubunit Na+/H+ antiporter MnhC subunit